MIYVSHYSHYFSPYMFGWIFLYIVARLVISFILRATRKKRKGEQE